MYFDRFTDRKLPQQPQDMQKHIISFWECYNKFWLCTCKTFLKKYFLNSVQFITFTTAKTQHEVSESNRMQLLEHLTTSIYATALSLCLYITTTHTQPHYFSLNTPTTVAIIAVKIVTVLATSHMESSSIDTSWCSAGSCCSSILQFCWKLLLTQHLSWSWARFNVQSNTL